MFFFFFFFFLLQRAAGMLLLSLPVKLCAPVDNTIKARKNVILQMTVNSFMVLALLHYIVSLYNISLSIAL